MTTLHFEANALPEVARKVLATAFPSYTGRKFKVEFADSVSVNNLWEGGSRTTTRFVRLDTFAVYTPPDSYRAGTMSAPILTGLCAVQHDIFCGEDMGITFVVPTSEAKLFPLPVATLTDDECIVLYATRSFKSSYAGRSNYRFHEASQSTGITLERWDAAKASCTARGLLNKAGAITVAGRNALGNTRPKGMH